MGQWLIECRRENVERATDGFFETDWESFEGYSHEYVSNLCASNRDSGLSNNLMECVKLCKMTNVIQALMEQPKESNLFILPPIEFSEDIMKPVGTEALKKMWRPVFVNTLSKDDIRYSQDKFSDICLPI